jgi:signal peptidase I
MKSLFTKGRFLSFAVSVVLVFLLWGYVFTPGGNGANVILALAVAIFVIYSATTSFGPVIDDWIFHGGSRERALALRKSEMAGQEIAARLSKVKSRYKAEHLAQFETCQNATDQLLATIHEMRAQVNTDQKNVAADIKKAALAEKNALSAAEAFFGKAVGSKRGFFSGWLSLALALAAAISLRIFIVEPYQIPSGSMIPELLVGDHLFVSKLSYGIMNPFAKEPSYLVRWNTPKPGEVVVFQAPSYVPRHAGETWIKRVIAGPGQTVRLVDSVVYVDDKPYAHVVPETTVKYKDFIGLGSQSSYSIGSGEGYWEEREGIETVEQIGDVKHQIYQNPRGERNPVESDWPKGVSLPGLDCDYDSCKVKEGYVFCMGDNRGFSSDGRSWGAVRIDNVKGKALFIWMSVNGDEKSVDLGRFTLPGFRWSRWFQAIR